MKTVSVINGPNLNLLGTRDPKIYGKETLKDIEKSLETTAKNNKIAINFFQSNVEGEIVTAIQSALGKSHGIIINPAAYSHTSIAIADALENAKFPVIEVHLSNIFKREPFRHHSHVSRVASGCIIGFGGESYRLALEAMIRLL